MNMERETLMAAVPSVRNDAFGKIADQPPPSASPLFRCVRERESERERERERERDQERRLVTSQCRSCIIARSRTH